MRQEALAAQAFLGRRRRIQGVAMKEHMVEGALWQLDKRSAGVALDQGDAVGIAILGKVAARNLGKIPEDLQRGDVAFLPHHACEVHGRMPNERSDLENCLCSYHLCYCIYECEEEVRGRHLFEIPLRGHGQFEPVRPKLAGVVRDERVERLVIGWRIVIEIARKFLARKKQVAMLPTFHETPSCFSRALQQSRT